MTKPMPQLESKCHNGRSCVLQLRHSKINNNKKEKTERKKTEAVISIYPWISGSQLGPVDICLPLETLFVTAGGRVLLVSSGQSPRMLPTILHGNDSRSQQRLACHKCQARQDWAPQGQSRVCGEARPSHCGQRPLEPRYSLYWAFRSHTNKVTFLKQL